MIFWSRFSSMYKFSHRLSSSKEVGSDESATESYKAAHAATDCRSVVSQQALVSVVSHASAWDCGRWITTGSAITRWYCRFFDNHFLTGTSGREAYSGTLRHPALEGSVDGCGVLVGAEGGGVVIGTGPGIHELCAEDCGTGIGAGQEVQEPDAEDCTAGIGAGPGIHEPHGSSTVLHAWDAVDGLFWPAFGSQ